MRPKLDEEPDLDEVEDEGEYGTTENAAPAQIWLEVTGPMNDALCRIHRCIQEGDYEATAIINFAEAASNAIERDIIDHPEWRSMDRHWGRVSEEYGDSLKAAHFLARYRLIRELLRKYNVVGRKAQSGEPARFLSFASLIPKVRD
jgi:hypothetical protein